MYMEKSPAASPMLPSRIFDDFLKRGEKRREIVDIYFNL